MTYLSNDLDMFSSPLSCCLLLSSAVDLVPTQTGSRKYLLQYQLDSSGGFYFINFITGNLKAIKQIRDGSYGCSALIKFSFYSTLCDIKRFSKKVASLTKEVFVLTKTRIIIITR